MTFRVMNDNDPDRFTLTERIMKRPGATTYYKIAAQAINMHLGIQSVVPSDLLTAGWGPTHLLVIDQDTDAVALVSKSSLEAIVVEDIMDLVPLDIEFDEGEVF